MSLYPEGHPPFMLCGLIAEEEITVEGIRRIVLERNLQMCLNSAYGDLMFGRHHLEQLRAWLFHAEQLIDTQSLPARQTTPKFPLRWCGIKSAHPVCTSSTSRHGG